MYRQMQKLIVTCNEDLLHEHDVHIRRSYSCNKDSLHENDVPIKRYQIGIDALRNLRTFGTNQMLHRFMCKLRNCFNCMCNRK